MSDTEAQFERPAPTIAEVHRILRAEFSYWRDAEPSDETTRDAETTAVFDGIRIGAIGAIANVMAAINGHPAPWHRRDYKPETEPTKASVRSALLHGPNDER